MLEVDPKTPKEPADHQSTQNSAFQSALKKFCKIGAPQGRHQVFANLGIEVKPDELNGYLQTVPLSGSWLDLRKCMNVLERMQIDGQAIMKQPEIRHAASHNILEMLKVPFDRLKEPMRYERLLAGNR